jgi:hypothetical protein
MMLEVNETEFRASCFAFWVILVVMMIAVDQNLEDPVIARLVLLICGAKRDTE